MPDIAQFPLPHTLLPLPGFLPDAVSYATRLALAMLLAYYVSFLIQLDSASSAGVCVAIVMQPVPGMAISKAFYRTIGTFAGGAAALVITGLFPQDRTMLLLATAAWLGACTFVASLLRDFRAYGAVLAGYTVAIVAVGQISAPANVLLTTLDRVAAILIGILCVALVNAVFVANTAHQHLLAELRRHLAEARDTALAVLSTGARPLRDVSLERASVLLALRTDAAYASAELADGLRRNRTAIAALAALLDMLAASRSLGRALGTERDAAAPGTHAFLGHVAASIRTGGPPPSLPGLPAAPLDAVLVDRAGALARAYAAAARAVDAMTTGELDGVDRRVRIPSDPDRGAAALNAARAIIATGLGAVLCVLGNDASTTLLLIQLAAFVALLGLQPNPSAAAATFLPGLPLAAALAGGVAFLLLPRASGFGPFALAVGPAVFAMGVAARQPRLTPYVPAMLIYFTILLSPSNVQAFNLAVFANLVLQLLLATVLTGASFRLILPVNPRRRLVRVADRVAQSLRRALHGGGGTDSGHWQPSLAYDRLAQGLLWARQRRPGLHPVVSRLCLLAETDAAATHAWRGLRDAAAHAPDLQPLARAGEAGLARAEADALEEAARALLAHPAAASASDAVLRAVAGLHGTAWLIRRQGSALRRYGVTAA